VTIRVGGDYPCRVQVRGGRDLIVLAAVVFAVAPAAAAAGAGAARPPARLVVDGESTLRVWLATTEQTRGLGVHRRPLRPGVGMWFAWPGPTSSGFWMRGVSYPLLIVWVGGDRRVIGLRRMAPCSRTAPDCPVYAPPRSFRFAIELLPADLKRSGLRVGARVRLGSVR